MGETEISRRKMLGWGAGLAAALFSDEVFGAQKVSPKKKVASKPREPLNLQREDYMRVKGPEIDNHLRKDIDRVIGHITSKKSRLDDRGRMFSNVFRFRDYIKANCTDVSPLFACSMIGKESSGRINAESKAGARGLAQITEDTGRDLGLKITEGVDQRLDPQKSIEAGLKYLQDNFRRVGSNKVYALAAYNWGPENLDRTYNFISKWGDITWKRLRWRLPDETKRYVVTVLAYEEMLGNLEKYGLKIKEASLYSEEIEGKTRTQHRIRKGENLARISDKYEVDQKSIKEINPSLINFSLAQGEIARIPHA